MRKRKKARHVLLPERVHFRAWYYGRVMLSIASRFFANKGLVFASMSSLNVSVLIAAFSGAERSEEGSAVDVKKHFQVTSVRM